jgi:hypothetical protein
MIDKDFEIRGDHYIEGEEEFNRQSVSPESVKAFLQMMMLCRVDESKAMRFEYDEEDFF